VLINIIIVNFPQLSQNGHARSVQWVEGKIFTQQSALVSYQMYHPNSLLSTIYTSIFIAPASKYYLYYSHNY